jgi:hypothetical protein
VSRTGVPQIASLPPRDRRMVDLIAAGTTQAGAADALGVNRSTVVRRLRRPEIQAALRTEAVQMRSTLVRRLTAEGLAAITRLAAHATDPDIPPAERARADARLAALAVQVQPHEIDVTAVSVAAVQQPRDRSAIEQLNEALERARDRLGLGDLAPSGNGHRGNGDG